MICNCDRTPKQKDRKTAITTLYIYVANTYFITNTQTHCSISNWDTIGLFSHVSFTFVFPASISCCTALLPVFHLLLIYPSPFAPFSVFRGIPPPPVSAIFISISEPSLLGGSLEYKVSTVSSVAIAILSSKISSRLVSLLTIR